MLFNIYTIVLTGFAIFGVYCFLDMVFMLLYLRKSPKSITLMALKDDKYTYKKVTTIQNAVPNNEIIFVTDEKAVVYPGTQQVAPQNIYSYISTHLFTK